MKLVTPNAATVSTVSDVGPGRMVESSLVLRLVVADLGVTSREVSLLLLLLLLLLLGTPVPNPDLRCGGWDRE